MYLSLVRGVQSYPQKVGVAAGLFQPSQSHTWLQSTIKLLGVAPLVCIFKLLQKDCFFFNWNNQISNHGAIYHSVYQSLSSDWCAEYTPPLGFVMFRH